MLIETSFFDTFSNNDNIRFANYNFFSYITPPLVYTIYIHTYTYNLYVLFFNLFKYVVKYIGFIIHRCCSSFNQQVVFLGYYFNVTICCKFVSFLVCLTLTPLSTLPTCVSWPLSVGHQCPTHVNHQ